MTALDHIKRYPNARTSTLAHLMVRDKLNEQLRKDARFLNRIRVKAVSRRIEPLDAIAMPEDQKQRIREGGF